MLNSLRRRLKGKVLLIGVGNPMRGDDAVGPALIEGLDGRVDAALINGGEVPESYMGSIINAGADTIVFIDAVDLKTEPGSLAIIEIDDLKGLNFSTHQLSLELFMNCLRAETGADIFLMGIQPRATHLGEPISLAILQTLSSLENALVEILGKRERPEKALPDSNEEKVICE